MKRESDGRLALRKRVLRNLDDGTLEAAAGGFDPTTIVTVTQTIAETVAKTVTIVLSSPCSNVFSKCSSCPPATIA